MKLNFTLWLSLAFAVLAAVLIAFTFRAGPIEVVQRGFRGVGMQTVYDKGTVQAQLAANVIPNNAPLVKAGPLAKTVYKNVQVLGDVSVGEFTGTMAAITKWVSPAGGCGYCHNLKNMASDEIYTKVVARRMLQMVKHTNADWQTHVQGVGVTCYTCHRGMPVPSNIWFNDESPMHANGMAEANTGKNLAAPAAGLSSLPYDPYTPFLENAANIRVQTVNALPSDSRVTINQTDWTYSLMMHFANSLGVNCTYCHNSRAFSDWSQSTPQRTTAWYGIRMVRDLNANYLGSLQDVFPPVRKGRAGDVAKLNCATCHQGVYKPLFGVSALANYPMLATNQQVASLTSAPGTAASGPTATPKPSVETGVTPATSPAPTPAEVTPPLAVPPADAPTAAPQ